MLPLECGSAAQIWCWLSHLIQVWISELGSKLAFIIIIIITIIPPSSQSFFDYLVWQCHLLIIEYCHFYHSNAKIIIRLMCIVSINCLFGIVVIFQFFQLMPRDKLEAVFRWYCNAAVSWRCWICKRPWCCEAWRWGILMKARDTLVSWLVIF